VTNLKQYIGKRDYIYLILAVVIFLTTCMVSAKMDSTYQLQNKQSGFSIFTMIRPSKRFDYSQMSFEEVQVEETEGLNEYMAQREEEQEELQITDDSIEEDVKLISDSDIDLLARIISCEMGCSWIPDEQQLYVGSVVLNRVASDLFPNTLQEVIYQPGQYAPAISGWLETVVPDERTRENAKWLLENGSVLPNGVLYQSTVAQGPIYTTYYDATLGTTTYYCYG